MKTYFYKEKRMYAIYIFIFLFCPALLYGQTPDDSPAGGISGLFNVSETGAVTYSVPIEVPQGVGGMQPNLSIVYNSQAGNGVVGWGCNLSGISVITRAPDDIYHDGFANGLTYLADDAYYLDGKRLIYVSGTAGQEGAIYNLESDPFTRIVVHGAYNATTANSWFEVQASNGTRYCYGSTASSRQSYTSGTSPRINAWYLDYVQDPMGNCMTYSYNNWQYFMYLNTIIYSRNIHTSSGITNTIKFNYNYRDDSTPFFLEKVKGQMMYRLSSIETKSESSIHRKYEFNYDTTSDGTSTKFSRLTSIVVKNAAGESLKPLTLHWMHLPYFSESASAVTVNAASTYPSMTFAEQQFTSGDFNGDGLTDLLGIAPVKIPTGPGSYKYDTYAYVYYASLDANKKVQFVTGRNYSLGPSFEMGDWKEHRGGSSVIDFDGDGINEFIVPHLSVSSSWKEIAFYIYSTTMQHVFRDNLQYSSEMVTYAMGDVNRDGKGDVAFIEKGQSGGKYPGKIFGLNSGTTIYLGSFNLSLPATPQKMFLQDFNGNGLEDMMILYDSGYTIYWNQGSGISASTFSDSYKTTGTNVSSDKWTMVRSGDFNGDGLSDFVFNKRNSNTWYFALNNADGTFSITTAATINAYDQSSTSKDDDKFEVFVTDFDGDGKDDLIIVKTMYSPTLTSTYWMRSTGSYLQQLACATSTKEDDGLSYRYMMGDFDGDGYPELINYGYNCYNSVNANTTPRWLLYKRNGISPGSGKVDVFTDSYGSTTSVTYTSLINGGIYTKGTGSSYPMIDCALPLHAAKTVYIGNSVGSSRIDYEYGGLKAHLQGKGLLGMSLHKATNTTQGTVVESGVKSWNTTFYIPASTYAKTSVDGKTAETNITLAVADKGSRKYFSYPTTQTKKDLDGNTVTTMYRYNTTYGYIEEEKNDYGNDMYKMVQYGNYTLAGGSYKPQLVTLTQKHTDDATPFTKRTTFTYDASKGYQKQVVKDEGTALQLTTDYTYDSVGNVLTSRESGSGITPVTVRNEYDTTCRFLTKRYTIPSSSVLRFTYDTWGNVLTEVDETLSTNALTTTHTYDGWGNHTSTIYPDGTNTTVQWGWEAANNPQRRYFILTQGTGQPWIKTWYDNKGREMESETIGEKNMAIRKVISYNDKGQVSERRVWAGDLVTTDYYQYDARGRISSFTNNAGQNITYTYDNRKVKTISNARAYEKTVDAWGGVKSVTDPVSSIAYTYSSIGKPKSIATGGATSTMSYDAVGNQESLTDPNAGTYTYAYDAAGRLTRQVDGKGIVTVNNYDALGRLATTTTDGVATTYTYGTTGYDLLLLTKVQTGNNYMAYSYDRYGRVSTEKRNVDGSGLLEFAYNYNTIGQLSSTLYPDGVQVDRQYDAYGNLWKVLVGTQSIWESTSATGTVYTSLLGGTLTSTRTYNSQGLLSNLNTKQGATVLHNMNYVFDSATGNLTSRTGMLPQTESFTFDKLDRLTVVKQDSETVMNMDYKPNGNINSKTGLGIYRYDTRPHAVTSVKNVSGLLSPERQEITYTPFNKVSDISQKVGTDNLALSFTYGPDRQRWKTELKKNNVLQKTIIFGGNYEKVTENGVTKQLYYINGGDGLAAVYVKQSGQTDKIYYPHVDHLGSIVKLTDGNGTEVFKASYDAWGNQTVINNSFAFHRGYTGHEHLREFGVINMNGRIYDPVLGCFFSPDPFVQMPEFSQNFNRYSYCLNNPLRYTDPSGEWFGIDDLLIAAVGFVFNYTSYGISTGSWGWKAVAAGGTGAVSGWLGYNTAGLSQGVISGGTLTYAGSMGINTVFNQFVPSATIPIGNNWGVSASAGLGFGTQGLTGGANIGVSYINDDFSIGAGVGIGTNNWGWNAVATHDGWGVGYGQTYYSASTAMGKQFGTQTTGTLTGYFNHNSFSFANDVLGDKEDRWRTNAVELNVGKFSFGTYLYTNNGIEASKVINKKEPTEDKAAPFLGKNKDEAWLDGRAYFAPAWIGYKRGNQVTRIGYSHKTVQNLTQNAVHKYLTPTPYFLNYNEFKTGGYFYSGYNNPFSLWER